MAKITEVLSTPELSSFVKENLTEAETLLNAIRDQLLSQGPVGIYNDPIGWRIHAYNATTFSPQDVIRPEIGSWNAVPSDEEMKLLFEALGHPEIISSSVLASNAYDHLREILGKDKFRNVEADIHLDYSRKYGGLHIESYAFNHPLVLGIAETGIGVLGDGQFKAESLKVNEAIISHSASGNWNDQSSSNITFEFNIQEPVPKISSFFNEFKDGTLINKTDAPDGVADGLVNMAGALQQTNAFFRGILDNQYHLTLIGNSRDRSKPYRQLVSFLCVNPVKQTP